jgi:peroxiredoxin
MAVHFPSCHFVLLIFFLSVITKTESQTNAYQINGQLSNFDGEPVYLAMLYGDNQYMIDTATVEDGRFSFEGPFNLKSGFYLVVLPSKKSFFILIDEHIPEFSFEADAQNIEQSLSFHGSIENDLYYEYVRFMAGITEDLKKMKSEYDSYQSDAEKLSMYTRMQQLKEKAISYQTQLIDTDPLTLTAALVKSEFTVEVPNFEGTPEEIQWKRYRYYKDHYFDHTDLTDERLIRAPQKILVDKVNYYLDKLTIQHPDSIIASIDWLLAQFESSPSSYRFFLSYFFNKYRESKNIGMDAIYVHIARNYIAKGKAPWIEESEKNKILTAIETIEPTLIGTKAPDFKVQSREGKNIRLYDIESPYTVLFFWSPQCSHCQKSMPSLREFYTEYKSKGVEIFAVCTKVNEQEKECWEYLDLMEFHQWINASDKTGGKSSVHVLYNIKNTPKIYVLNEDKTILAKDFGVEQLREVMTKIIPDSR